MEVRILTTRGGDGTVFSIFVLHDTDSNTLSLYNTDIAHMGTSNNYGGWLHPAEIHTATGEIIEPLLLVETRYVDENLVPRSPWFIEGVCIRQAELGIRFFVRIADEETFILWCSPNGTLAIVSTKDGMVSLLD